MGAAVTHTAMLTFDGTVLKEHDSQLIGRRRRASVATRAYAYFLIMKFGILVMQAIGLPACFLHAMCASWALAQGSTALLTWL